MSQRVEQIGDCTLYLGDCLEVLPTLEAGSVDAVVTDPPYGLDFMGKEWDHGVPGVAFWTEVRHTLKPAGYMLAFGGTRTFHRLACAIEDAGFEIRDCLNWLYGSGFPKAKSCLKPAWELILLARKPGPRVLPLGIDECRVGTTVETWPATRRNGAGDGRTCANGHGPAYTASTGKAPSGRWPANVVHDGSDEVLEAFAAFGEKTSGKEPTGGLKRNAAKFKQTYSPFAGQQIANGVLYGDTGTAARFFYCAKASSEERGEGNTHPTVKPLSLMDWLVKLVARPGETVLDPFMGSGTTGVACFSSGRRFVGIERDENYFDIACKRIEAAVKECPLFEGISA